MKRNGPGHYTKDTAKGPARVVKVEGHGRWVWLVETVNGTEGGHDWFFTKAEAVEALDDFLK